MVNNRFNVATNTLKEFCLKYGIKKLSLFGSALREDFTPDSDIDVLVEFTPDATVGYLRLAQMEIELSALLHRQADIRTPAEISHYFRQQVLQQAEPQYVLE